VKRRDLLKFAALAITCPSIVVANNIKVPVLMYHEIIDDPNDPTNEYSISPATFAEQMQWLADNGYHAIPFSEINNADPKSVIITFDDGYQSFFDHAWPVLKEHGFYSTVNLVGAWVGGMVPNKNPRPAMSWDEIKTLYATGMVTFGCHTYDQHHYETKGVSTISEDVLTADFLKFQSVLKEKIGVTTNIIAWPFGYYSDAAYKAGDAAGFDYYLTMHSGYYDGNRWYVPRFDIKRGVNLRDVLTN
jgi:peptidoglycan/xylan/chitin deacetylase (PgdA/CDA1 family)